VEAKTVKRRASLREVILQKGSPTHKIAAFGFPFSLLRVLSEGTRTQDWLRQTGGFDGGVRPL